MDEQREQRILDAATELFLRYGYDKTTVAEVAERAGISKGAIYLHFASKDELLEALLARETAAYAMRWREQVEADPSGGTIGGMYCGILLGLGQAPLLAAMFRQDVQVLGSYLRKPGNRFQREQARSLRPEFVTAMQQAGAVRGNLPPDVLAHIMDVIAYGLLSIGDVKAATECPPLEEVVRGLATILDSALTPPDVDASERGKAVLRALLGNPGDPPGAHKE